MKKIASEMLEYCQKMASRNAEHMRDVLSQEGNTNINNEISADSASVQTEPIANSLAPEILPSVNERLPDPVTSILAQKSLSLPQVMMNLMKKNLIGTHMSNIKWLEMQLLSKPVIGTQVTD